MSKPVDVVAVLRRNAAWHNTVGNYHEAIEAVAELIAADVEYDAAEDALNKRGCFEDEGPMILRMKLAEERRAAALAACKPATGAEK